MSIHFVSLNMDAFHDFHFNTGQVFQDSDAYEGKCRRHEDDERVLGECVRIRSEKGIVKDEKTLEVFRFGDEGRVAALERWSRAVVGGGVTVHRG